MENVEKTEWDLSPLLLSDNDPKEQEKIREIEILAEQFTKKWENNSYLSDPQTMKMALDDFEFLSNKIGDGGGEVQYYFWLRTQQDQSDTEIKAKFKKIEEKGKEISNKLIFFTNNIAKIPIENHFIFLNSEHLKNYKHYLEKLFAQGKYLLSDKEEKILALKSSVSYSNWKNISSSLISKEEREIEINEKKENKNFSEILSLLNDKNKKVRDDAARSLNNILEKYSEIAEAEINSILEDKKINDSLRGFNSPDRERHLNDDIETDIVYSLLLSVTEKFNIPKEYYKLKAKLLGLKKLEYHERNVEYGKIDKEYDIKNSVALINKTFSDINLEFSIIFGKFLNENRVDFLPKKGKRSGAFCVWWSPSKPVYLLLNYTNKLMDVLTFAHELGHGINAELSKKQNSLNFNTPISAAEIASTFFEDFVLEELLQNADNELKLSIYMQKLNDDITTIFRQVACYNFEKELHIEFRKKGYLSKEEIGRIFKKNMEAYMGDYVEQSKGSENWWIHWSHIRNYFYVYSYAFGLLISKNLQKKTKENKAFIDKIKLFLSKGSSDSPKNIFLNFGIDISQKEFWEESLREVESLLEKTTSLAKRLNKL